MEDILRKVNVCFNAAKLILRKFDKSLAGAAGSGGVWCVCSSQVLQPWFVGGRGRGLRMRCRALKQPATLGCMELLKYTGYLMSCVLDDWQGGGAKPATGGR
ncbi:MAG: hypothetical protein CML13_16735 [Puniceicoccaceae bacterium]|nr:hypothetical protein [Puniceicoccaceae bacterium]|tara:strand:- start:1939 stop:2244 length:306 start_codon:yes stop_codon:yes gene_type:complete